MHTPRKLRRLLHHPAVNLTVAAILIATSLAEIWRSLIGEASHMEMGSQYGVLTYGFVQAARAIPELFEGVERAEGSRGGGVS